MLTITYDVMEKLKFKTIFPNAGKDVTVNLFSVCFFFNYRRINSYESLYTFLI